MSGMTDAEAIGIVFAAISNEAYEKTQPALHHIAARLRGEAQAEQQAVAWSIMEPSDEPGIDFYHTLRIRFPGEPQPPNATPLYTRPQAALSSTAAPVADATCPRCKAPCKRTVNMRGGDYGWSTTDEERADYAYAAPAPVAGDAVVRLMGRLRAEVADDYVRTEYGEGSRSALKYAADELEAALAQDRAAQAAPVDTSTNEACIARAESKLAAPVGVPEGMVLIQKRDAATLVNHAKHSPASALAARRVSATLTALRSDAEGEG